MRLEQIRGRMRWAMVLFYAAAGIVHLRSPEAFLAIMPGWVVEPRQPVLLTGLCEIAGAAGLLVRALRDAAGVLLALYAVCVFPANLQHAFANIDVAGLPSSWWYHAPRLAFQPVLVWWALFCAGLLDWPFRPAPRSPSHKPRAPMAG